MSGAGIRALGDVLAIEAAGLPADLPADTYSMLRRGMERNPQAKALSFFLRTEDHRKPEVWTYAALFAKITQTANLFHTLGIGRDEVVAYVLPNLPETHFTIWGGQAAGIVCAINPLLEAGAIVDLLNAAGARVLVTLAPFPGADLWSRLQPLLGQVPTLRHVVQVSLAHKVPGVKGWAAAFMQRREVKRLHGAAGMRGALPASIGLHRFHQAVARQPDDRLISGRVIDADDLSSYFCTGGTTGTPKLAMRRHRNEVSNAWSAAQFLGSGINADKNLFCGLPLFHVNGVMITGLVPFSQGAHVILGTPQGYRGEGVVARFWELVEHHRIHFFSGVPTLYSTLLQIPIDGRKIDSLEFGLCGAAPLPVETVKTFQQRTGLKILEGYGLTEGTCVSTSNPPRGERRSGSVGLRVPLQQMKAVQLDDEGRYVRDCTVDEVGVLAICGPNVFAGYKVAEHNKGLWIDMGDAGPWLNTGDLGRQDAQGFFYLTGRKKELIIRGGHNLDPQCIEDPLHRHPAVQLAAAVGRPDAHAGELPVVYVQLHAGASASEDELMAFAQQHILERAAVPKAIRIIGRMPLTAVGKIFKPELKILETRDAIAMALQAGQVEWRSLEVVADATRGLTLKVTLADLGDEARARGLLGQFPFSFSLE